MENDIFQVYEDINTRTNGEIYIGVVGPMRTGKSTFIKNFMETLVIPQITDENERKRAIDELPQSGAGRTITTTEPKFIPKEAVNIEFSSNQAAKVRLIDCVGYMVDGVSGHLEDNKERMVKTPWSEKEMPFSQAAKIGTTKVINDHSTIGLIITTDGSISDLPRENYIKAENDTIEALKEINKPFLVIVNSVKPYSEETKAIADEIAQKHNVVTIPLNCMQLRKTDINHIMQKILSVFPISQINFYYPVWCQLLEDTHPVMQLIFEQAKKIVNEAILINDIDQMPDYEPDDYIEKINVDDIDLKTGTVFISYVLNETLYYKVLSEMTGVQIDNDYKLISILKELASMKNNLLAQSQALEMVTATGYSVVKPSKDDIEVYEPMLIKHGNKFGIKIKATATSIHMIKAPIETEIAPIVGTQEQANDLIRYINETTQNNPSGIWNTNIFGKSVEQLINEGIDYKINRMSDETRDKMQQTLKKIVNESNGGVICIII